MPVVPVSGGLSVGPRPLPQIRTSLEDFGGGQAAERPTGAGLGQAAVNIYQAEKQKADQVAIVDAGSKLSALETSSLYGPNGALSQRGKNAFDAMTTVQQGWQKGVADIGNGLTNGEQRASFNQMVQSHWASINAQVQHHVAGERQKFDDDAVSAYITNEHTRAVAAFDKPEVVEQALGNQIAAIQDHAKRNGLPDEWTQEQTARQTSSVRLGVVEQFLNTGADLKASAYVDAHHGDFVGNDLSEAEKLTEAGSVRGESQRRADDITRGFPGMLSQGNIDLTKRPRVQNPDGSISTVRSISIEKDGKEILIPTVSDDGRIMSNDEAIALYERTGNNLGTFRDAASADAYAERLHLAQADMIAGRSNGVPLGGATSLMDALKQVDAIAEPRVRDAAEQRVRRYFEDQAANQRQEQSAAFARVGQAVETNGGDVHDPSVPIGDWLKLSVEERSAIQRRADEIRHPRRYTDPDVYHNLMNMAGLPGSRDSFKQLNLLPYREALSDQDYQRIVNLQTQARVSDQRTADAHARSDQLHADAIARSDSLRTESHARSDSLRADTRARSDSIRKVRDDAKAAKAAAGQATLDSILGRPSKAPGGPITKPGTPTKGPPIPLKPISMNNSSSPSVPQTWVDHALTEDPEYADYLEHMGVTLG